MVVTARRVLGAQPSVVQIVPLTSTVRGFASEVEVAPDDFNGVTMRSAAQCQEVRAVAVSRIERTVGNVGPTVLTQIRDLVGLTLDTPIN